MQPARTLYPANTTSQKSSDQSCICRVTYLYSVVRTGPDIEVSMQESMRSTGQYASNLLWLGEAPRGRVHILRRDQLTYVHASSSITLSPLKRVPASSNTQKSHCPRWLVLLSLREYSISLGFFHLLTYAFAALHISHRKSQLSCVAGQVPFVHHAKKIVPQSPASALRFSTIRVEVQGGISKPHVR